MSKYVHKSHNVSVLLYHLVCPAKYRRGVFTDRVDAELKKICQEIAERYDVEFVEIGVDKDHVHFLIQSVPMYSPGRIAQIVKSITAKEIFKRVPEVKKYLWGGAFWTSGYFMSTVGQRGNEETVREYLRDQGLEKEYKSLHRGQLSLF